MAEVIVKKEGLEDVEFFGKVDRNKDGKIASEVPSWYLTQNKDELVRNIEYTEGALRREEIPQEEKPITIARLDQMKRKLGDINESHPKFEGNQQDAIAKVSDGLGKKIKDAMYSRSDMMRGVADAHEEARRMADPCIKLSGDEYVLAQKAGCRVSKDGMVSRTDAERTWKLARRALGENSNTETLRKQ